MAEQRHICIVTGSRADYGYLRPLMRLVEADPDCRLSVIATGMQLWKEFGETWREIEADGFRIDRRVGCPFTGTGVLDVAGYVGTAVPGFAQALTELRPDVLVLLGDRYEIFAAAQAAMFAGVPVAHLAGGDVTEGAFDEAIRHSITKMAHLHFVTNADSGRRVCQLGEDPQRVFNVGATSLDSVAEVPRLSRSELESDLGFAFRQRNVVATFHPVTLEARPSSQQFAELLGALDDCGAGSDLGVVFTAPNADTEGLDVMAMLQEWASGRDGIIVRKSLGLARYYSVLENVDAVIGNSSSGLYEAPSFGIPTVNIGDRQRGRSCAESVLHCEADRKIIAETLREALAMDCTGVTNPYGDGKASARILRKIKAVDDPKSLIMKHFFEVDI